MRDLYLLFFLFAMVALQVNAQSGSAFTIGEIWEIESKILQEKRSYSVSLPSSYEGDQFYLDGIEILKINTEYYPNSYLTHQSLAEGYQQMGSTALALEHLRKSLQINPSNEIVSSRFYELEKQLNRQPRKRITSARDFMKGDGLQRVESIIYDSLHDVFYTTSGKNYQIGEEGFISRISETGDLKDLKWVTGLNRPTGMAIQINKLYVADVNALVIIDTDTGQILEKLTAPVENPGLNDVVINKQGEVFVTASFIHAIYKVQDGQLKLWVEDQEKLKWVNGLTADEDQIIVAGLNLATVDRRSKKISVIETSAPVSDFDGISPDGSGGYYLTTVENSALWHLNAQQQIEKLAAGDAYFGDLEFVPELQQLFVARGDKAKDQYYISAYRLN